MADEEAKVGDVVKMPIIRGPDRPYLTVDTVLITDGAGPNAGIEMILLSFQNRYDAQQFTIGQDAEGNLNMTSGQYVGGHMIADLGAVRFTHQGALDAAMLLIKHLDKTNENARATILESLRSEGLLG